MVVPYHPLLCRHQNDIKSQCWIVHRGFFQAKSPAHLTFNPAFGCAIAYHVKRTQAVSRHVIMSAMRYGAVSVPRLLVANDTMFENVAACLHAEGSLGHCPLHWTKRAYGHGGRNSSHITGCVLHMKWFSVLEKHSDSQHA